MTTEDGDGLVALAPRPGQVGLLHLAELPRAIIGVGYTVTPWWRTKTRWRGRCASASPASACPLCATQTSHGAEPIAVQGPVGPVTGLLRTGYRTD
jgi:hypothetical protein